MKQQNRSLGMLAEHKTVEMLEQKGYTILKQNFSNRYGEIDIVAKDHETTVFIEVKAKTGSEMGLPEEMVSKGKLHKVRNMASLYLGGKDVVCRIDVVAVVFDEQQQIIRMTHYQNVY